MNEQTGWRERLITAAGVGIVAYEAGNPDPSARTVVLVHGLGHWTQAAWDVLLPLLDPALRIVAFDLPGFGRSDKPDVRYDSAFFDRIMAAVVDRLAPGRFVLCGHSLGGYIVAGYAAAHADRVERLIMIAPAGFLRAARFLYALLGSQAARWLFTRKPGRRFINGTLDRSVFEARSIGAHVRETAMTLAEEPAVRRAFAAVYTGAIQDFRDPRTLHARLRVWAGPTLIVWGRHDRFIPIAGLDVARAVYPGAEVLICERSGHLPMVEEAPLVAAAFARFIDTPAGNASATAGT